MDNPGKKFINNFINYLSALWAGIFAKFLLSLPISLIFDGKIFLQSIFHALCGIAGTAITLAIMTYRDGYKEEAYKISTTIGILLIIFIAQQCFAPLNGYKPASAGAAGDLATAIFLKGNTEDGSVSVLGNFICLTALQLFVYAPTMLISEYRGVKARRQKYGHTTNN
ncbi:MAG: hypothetical protein E7525_04035 [Ruminococcaceae bacterium]|nr:hypothetical protein [Oscillospiraceae bacterium]